MKTPQDVSPDETQDETSTPFVPDEYFRDFLAGKRSHPSQADFPAEFEPIAAEMNRRLMRAQANVLRSQNLRLEAQERLNTAQLEAAQSLKRATWVLSFATMLLAIATAVPMLRAFIEK